jgi:hypothetical protein
MGRLPDLKPLDEHRTVPSRLISRPFAEDLKSFIKQRWKNPEIGLLDLGEGAFQIDEPLPSRHFENADGSYDMKTASVRCFTAATLVNDNAIRANLARQVDGGYFTRVKFGDRLDRGRGPNLQPRRRCDNERPHRFGTL